MPPKKLRLPILVAVIAACFAIGSCQTEQKVTGYSYKHNKNPKFINDIALGGHKHSAINIGDVVEENDEDDATDVTNATTPTNNNYTTSNPAKKSKIKVQFEEAEPTGIKPPISTTFTNTVTTVAKNVTQTIGSLQEKYA